METTATKFIDELRAFADSWETAHNYEQHALPLVVRLNRDYRATGCYPYNNDVAKYIMARGEIPAELEKALETQVYLSQKQIRRGEEANQILEMARQAFLPFCVEHFDSMLNSGQIYVRFSETDIKKCKVIKDAEGHIFLLPPRHSRSGWFAWNLAHKDTKVFWRPL